VYLVANHVIGQRKDAMTVAVIYVALTILNRSLG